MNACGIYRVCTNVLQAHELLVMHIHTPENVLMLEVNARDSRFIHTFTHIMYRLYHG